MDMTRVGVYTLRKITDVLFGRLPLAPIMTVQTAIFCPASVALKGAFLAMAERAERPEGSATAATAPPRPGAQAAGGRAGGLGPRVARGGGGVTRGR